MKNQEALRSILNHINGRGYKAYKEIKGYYDFSHFTLIIDHVQGDPFASPSMVRISIPQQLARFPEDTYKNKSREIALRDFITRQFYASACKVAKMNRGTGKSGLITIDKPGQEILERSSVLVTSQFVEARFIIGLPAFGRRIASKEAEAMFFTELPAIAQSALFFNNLNSEKLYQHIETSEDADYIRSRLKDFNLVSFIANGAVLPRASGINPQPLEGPKVVSFRSPESMQIKITLPNRGEITGMGIPEGITLIVGGGYHGKSTLLNALMLGVYNHIPGDGREYVVTVQDAVKIRAEDGRRVEKVDISPFITNLPFGQETKSFSTEYASGSTSQASNIIEAIEAGARVLLIDEDTSATNFMIRDSRMQELVAKKNEPITPFIDKALWLFKNHSISTILVIGGAGDYFSVADRVICMTNYRPDDVTEKAKEIAARDKGARKQEGGGFFGSITPRAPLSFSLNPRKGKREVKISAKAKDTILFGTHSIDLSCVEQLVDISQTKAIGTALNYIKQYMDGRIVLYEILKKCMDDIKGKGLNIIGMKNAGDYALFRRIELAAALNRLRTLKVKQKTE